MATKTTTSNGPAAPWQYKDQDFILKGSYDFAAAGASAVQNDVIQMINVPAKTLVRAVFLNVITPEGEASTVQIGITGGTVDGFIASTSINAAAITKGTGAYLVASGGHWFATAGTIDALLNAAVTYNVGKIEVVAVCTSVDVFATA